MARFRIEYDRNGCIGAAVCAVFSEKDWVINEDRKADLVGARKEIRDGREIWVKEIDESELEANKQAADGCPAVVIKILDENGNVVAPSE